MNGRPQLRRFLNDLRAGRIRGLSNGTSRFVGDAVKAILDGADPRHALGLVASLEARVARDEYLVTASELLPEAIRQSRAAVAEWILANARRLENEAVAGEFDLERPSTWPPMDAAQQFVARAVASAPLPTRDRIERIIRYSEQDTG